MIQMIPNFWLLIYFINMFMLLNFYLINYFNLNNKKL